MISLRIQTERRTPALDALQRELGARRALNAALGKRVEKELRAHFAKREKEPNKRGWKKTHFWSRRIRANTAMTEANESSATVQIAAPEFRQKVFGGTIVPREAKWLAIPVIEEAYGRSPRLFSNLRFILLGPNRAMLVSRLASGPRQHGELRAGGENATYYFLRKRVHQKPDSRALPPEHETEAAIRDETARFLRRRTIR